MNIHGGRFVVVNSRFRHLPDFRLLETIFIMLSTQKVHSSGKIRQPTYKTLTTHFFPLPERFWLLIYLNLVSSCMGNVDRLFFDVVCTWTFFVVCSLSRLITSKLYHWGSIRETKTEQVFRLLRLGVILVTVLQISVIDILFSMRLAFLCFVE